MTEASFHAYSKLVTKHVLGDPSAFNELVESLAACEHAKSKSVAAALGYLVAMEDKLEKELSIYDKVLDEVEDSDGDALIRTDSIMTEVYCWLDKELEKEGYEEDGEVRGLLLDRFTPYIVSSNLDRT